MGAIDERNEKGYWDTVEERDSEEDDWDSDEDSDEDDSDEDEESKTKGAQEVKVARNKRTVQYNSIFLRSRVDLPEILSNPGVIGSHG